MKATLEESVSSKSVSLVANDDDELDDKNTFRPKDRTPVEEKAEDRVNRVADNRRNMANET